MKIALALLEGREIQNHARRIAAQINRESGLPFYAATLPSHISLKQPFSCDDLERLDAYCVTGRDCLAEARRKADKDGC